MKSNSQSCGPVLGVKCGQEQSSSTRKNPKNEAHGQFRGKATQELFEALISRSYAMDQATSSQCICDQHMQKMQCRDRRLSAMMTQNSGPVGACSSIPISAPKYGCCGYLEVSGLTASIRLALIGGG